MKNGIEKISDRVRIRKHTDPNGRQHFHIYRIEINVNPIVAPKNWQHLSWTCSDYLAFARRQAKAIDKAFRNDFSSSSSEEGTK